MKCRQCRKNMFEWSQMMCNYAVCQNKKCKFEGLVKIYDLEDSFKKFEKFKNEVKKLKEKQ
jgi:hypothetical protein